MNLSDILDIENINHDITIDFIKNKIIFSGDYTIDEIIKSLESNSHLQLQNELLRQLALKIQNDITPIIYEKGRYCPWVCIFSYNNKIIYQIINNPVPPNIWWEDSCSDNET
jgi:hypothetical protein